MKTHYIFLWLLFCMPFAYSHAQLVEEEGELLWSHPHYQLNTEGFTGTSSLRKNGEIIIEDEPTYISLIRVQDRKDLKNINFETHFVKLYIACPYCRKLAKEHSDYQPQHRNACIYQVTAYALKKQ